MTRSSIPLADIVAFLDAYLRIHDIPDAPTALNGLQVENSGVITRLVAAVDASQATIDGLTPARRATADLEARSDQRDAPLLLVHHGLFWDGNQPVTGRRYRRLRALLAQDAAVYSAHIPLDLHGEVGNNPVLARLLGLEALIPFGLHKGTAIGVSGDMPGGAIPREDLVRRLASALTIAPGAIRLLAGGGERVRRIGIITGGAGGSIAEAHAAKCDAYITGEGAAHTYFDAMELGINVLYAGHYATETVGVKALAQLLAERFSLPWSFHDHPTGM